ncbi:hypothetical protein TVAG_262450 [Trichomonas vaginalis G3]|uniref:DUF3447 domain-containing protein n=1 Tax=Trichomonas vaginalis (strain ATCC PRA-98 / G3) TaxID=412133 RepID=A2DUF7_TRIV3|nr:ankyrin repeat and SOCS box-containing protein 4 family [Trichomonas vaginalis G3]EAY15995.1 hypothetical protein TVAG_262450 [Trichomonas vaginalis G3]KAI5523564.1 ankyrin repeat and SOCS box-containing protein 4 family [Trichomonas vaginalis G3]|eukprot:XP_001328218.1 hypothetical protein [Trichomonas vaginalis G3]
MSVQDIHPNKYSELRSIYKYYIDSYNALYQLKTEKEENLNQIFKMIKENLIDTMKIRPQSIVRDTLNTIPYNNRYTRPYLTIAKLIFDDYHVKEVNNVANISKYLFYKEYGIKLDRICNFREYEFKNIDIHRENTIYKVIMYNDLERFIAFTETDGFDKDQVLNNDLYPNCMSGYSLLELCCYHGAVDCFKLLRTKFHSEITQECLELSFLGGNPEIMSECLKYQKPNKECMRYAIISHNIDFVTFLMNEYDLVIKLHCCGIYNNLESFLVYYDQSNDISKCFVYSAMFDIPSLCKYFLSLCSNINTKKKDGKTAIHCTAYKSCIETAEFLISHGANINEKDNDGQTAFHTAVYHNSKEIAELLISHGININEKDKYGKTALHIAAIGDRKEIAEFLISHGANINEKDEDGNTPLIFSAICNCKEIVELLISEGANINEKNNDGQTALYNARIYNLYFIGKETVGFLISHGAE